MTRKRTIAEDTGAEEPTVSVPAPQPPTLPDMLDASTDTNDVTGFINLLRNADHRFESKINALKQRLEAEEKKANNELADLDAQRARVIMRHDETKAEILLAISRAERNRQATAVALDVLEGEE